MRVVFRTWLWRLCLSLSISMMCSVYCMLVCVYYITLQVVTIGHVTADGRSRDWAGGLGCHIGRNVTIQGFETLNAEILTTRYYTKSFHMHRKKQREKKGKKNTREFKDDNLENTRRIG